MTARIQAPSRAGQIVIALLIGLAFAAIWFGPVFVIQAKAAPRSADPFSAFASAVGGMFATEPERPRKAKRKRTGAAPAVRNNPSKRQFITDYPSSGTVRASWYGGGERLNRHTANGEIFRPAALTCAHRSLPFGTQVKVTHSRSGRSVTCRVNDRGPAKWTGRDIDLSRGAAQAIGMFQAGEARVRIEVVR